MIGILLRSPNRYCRLWSLMIDVREITSKFSQQVKQSCGTQIKLTAELPLVETEVKLSEFASNRPLGAHILESIRKSWLLV